MQVRPPLTRAAAGRRARVHPCSGCRTGLHYGGSGAGGRAIPDPHSSPAPGARAGARREKRSAASYGRAGAQRGGTLRQCQTGIHPRDRLAQCSRQRVHLPDAAAGLPPQRRFYHLFPALLRTTAHSTITDYFPSRPKPYLPRSRTRSRTRVQAALPTVADRHTARHYLHDGNHAPTRGSKIRRCAPLRFQ